MVLGLPDWHALNLSFYREFQAYTGGFDEPRDGQKNRARRRCCTKITAAVGRKTVWKYCMRILEINFVKRKNDPLY